MLHGSSSFVGILFSLLRTTIVVKFDGSLRFPSDPGFPTRNLHSIAACAAYISVTNNNTCENVFTLPVAGTTTVPREEGSSPKVVQAKPQQFLFLGGKLLNDSRGIRNSAEPEYEGLILGLEGLLSLLTADQQKYPPKLNQHSNVGVEEVVTIQGDCKTVIQQMQGRSRPRKLQRYHDRAHQLVERLLPLCKRIQFEHIPRSENWLCDQLCFRMILHKEMTTLHGAWVELHKIALAAIMNKSKNTALETTTTSSPILASSSSSSSFVSLDTKNSCNSFKITDYLTRYFSHSSNLIRFSARPAIYRWLALLAKDCNDNNSLIEIGKRLEGEARDVWRIHKSGDSSKVALSKVETLSLSQQQEEHVVCSSLEHERLLVDALVYITSGLKGTGRSKEAAQISRQSQYILHKFAGQVNETNAFLNGGLQAAHVDEIMSMLLQANIRCGNDSSIWSDPVKDWYHQAINSSSAWKNTNEPLWVQVPDSITLL